MTLHLSQRPEADALLDRNPLALLVGMLLDQQVPIERAFAAPYELAERLGGGLDVREIAAYDPERFAAIAARRPAIHRFPGSMAKRIQQLCQYVVAEYDGDPEAIWRDASSGADLLARLSALPGYGRQKAQIFIALLSKHLGVRPRGWRAAAGEYGKNGAHRSVADIVDEASLLQVRAHKQELKARARAKSAVA